MVDGAYVSYVNYVSYDICGMLAMLATKSPHSHHKPNISSRLGAKAMTPWSASYIANVSYRLNLSSLANAKSTSQLIGYLYRRPLGHGDAGANMTHGS